MYMNNKIAPLLGFGLPLIFLLVVGMFVMTPRMNTRVPSTNFYYATAPWGTFSQEVQSTPLFVLNGQIVFQKKNNNTFFAECQFVSTWVNNQMIQTSPDPLPAICTEINRTALLQYSLERGLKVYLHDVQKNESSALNADQIVAMQSLDDSTKSPEGYTIETNGSYYGSSDLLFGGGGRYRSGVFLTQGSRKTEMNVRTSTNAPAIHFLGWIR